MPHPLESILTSTGMEPLTAEEEERVDLLTVPLQNYADLGLSEQGHLPASFFPRALPGPGAGRPPGYATAAGRPPGAPEPEPLSPQFARPGFTSGPATPPVLRRGLPIRRPRAMLDPLFPALGRGTASVAQGAFSAFRDPPFHWWPRRQSSQNEGRGIRRPMKTAGWA